MTKVRDLHNEWMADPAYRREFEALEADADSANSIPIGLASANEHCMPEEVPAGAISVSPDKVAW